MPVLKKGMAFSSTWTDEPVRGLRPIRASRFLIENAPKAAQLDPVAAGQGLCDLIENCRYDAINVALVQMRIELCQSQN